MMLDRLNRLTECWTHSQTNRVPDRLTFPFSRASPDLRWNSAVFLQTVAMLAIPDLAEPDLLYHSTAADLIMLRVANGEQPFHGHPSQQTGKELYTAPGHAGAGCI